MSREVLSLVFEFVITLVVLIGGGFLVYKGTATEIAVAAISTVIAFWFGNRIREQKTSQNNNTGATTPVTSTASASSDDTPKEQTPFDVIK